MPQEKFYKVLHVDPDCAEEALNYFANSGYTFVSYLGGDDDGNVYILMRKAGL